MPARCQGRGRQGNPLWQTKRQKAKPNGKEATLSTSITTLHRLMHQFVLQSEARCKQDERFTSVSTHICKRILQLVVEILKIEPCKEHDIPPFVLNTSEQELASRRRNLDDAEMRVVLPMRHRNMPCASFLNDQDETCDLTAITMPCKYMSHEKSTR